MILDYVSWLACCCSTCLRIYAWHSNVYIDWHQQQLYRYHTTFCLMLSCFCFQLLYYDCWLLKLYFVLSANGWADQDTDCSFSLFGGIYFLFLLLLCTHVRCVHVLYLHPDLQTGRFSQFWDEAAKSRQIVEAVPGNEDFLSMSWWCLF